MTKEKEDYLFKTYPNIFPPDEIRNDIQKSCLGWGFECSDGWFDLLEDLFKKLSALPDQVELEQVKEKYGTLRVYAMGSDEAFDLINEAEEKSATICEICGKAGTLHSDKGWMVCRCEEHYKNDK